MANYLVCDRCGGKIEDDKSHSLLSLIRYRYVLNFDSDGTTYISYDLCSKCKKKFDEFMTNVDDGPNLGGKT